MKRQLKILKMILNNLNNRDRFLAGAASLSLAMLTGTAVGPKTRKTVMTASFLTMAGCAIPVIYEIVSGMVTNQDIIFFDEYVNTDGFDEDL